MNRLLRLIVAFSLFIVSSGFDLHQPVLFDKGVTPRTAEQREASYVVYDTIKESGSNIYSVLSATDLSQGGHWYAFSRDLILYEINISNATLIGAHALTNNKFPCIATINCIVPASSWYTARWNNQETLESQIIDRYHNSELSLQVYFNPNESTLGCLGEVPLKYGDIEADGVKELVLYIGGNWMIFSTTLNKVTFMTMMDVSDWMTEQETLKYFAYYREPVNSLLPKEPQYQSSIFPARIGGVYNSTPGYRGYSKLYFGEFDNDSANAADILVWRKLYQSRLAEDPIKGFEKISDTYAHYSLVNGEYELQSSDESQIQAWLASNNQTWVTGYPSKSECEGQEGNLIQEIHDPLLNDPDVLPNQASGGD